MFAAEQGQQRSGPLSPSKEVVLVAKADVAGEKTEAVYSAPLSIDLITNACA